MLLFSSINFLAEEIIQTLSWTLLHSLWQGVVFSLIAGCIVFATKKTSSLQRYNLLAATLAFFILVVAATFVTQLGNAQRSVNALEKPAAQINIDVPAEDLSAIKSESSISTKAIAFFNANAGWIVFTWLLIIGYKFIRIGTSFYSLYQLKRRQVSSSGGYWNKRIRELCSQLQINKKVQLLQSGIVQIPAVVGYFKPVILFPAAMLNSLSVNEVEAVLIHELGHIRRKDFLVNMLQTIIEIVFFFNPAILWISSLLKTERENCCDDIAVTHTGNKQDYIKALISFQQFNQSATQHLATAFSGEKNHLLNRVKRIIYNNNKTLNNMEKKFLSASLILVSVCLFAFVSNKTRDDKKMKTPVLQPVPVSITETPVSAVNKQDIEKEKKNILQPVSAGFDKITNDVNVFAKMDSVPVYKVGGGLNLTGETNTSIDGKEYRIILKNSVVTELYINGQKIADEKIIDYKLMLDNLYSKMIANRNESMRNQEQSMRDQEQSIRDQEESKRNSEQAENDNKKIIQELIEDKIITSGENLSFFLSEVKFIVNDKKQPIEIVKKYFAKYGFKGSNRLYNFKTEHTGLPVSTVRAVPTKPTLPTVATEPTAPRTVHQIPIAHRAARADDRKMESIINELIRDNIIKDKKEIKSLSLNATELLVNGVKQPAAIHKKLKDKYVKSNTVTLWYETE